MQATQSSGITQTDKALYHAKNTGKNAIYELIYTSAGAKEKEASFIKIDF